MLLTAAQSLLAVVLLTTLRLSMGGALLLFGLFFGQFVLLLFSNWPRESVCRAAIFRKWGYARRLQSQA